jgi:hypothetical protein
VESYVLSLWKKTGGRGEEVLAIIAQDKTYPEKQIQQPGDSAWRPYCKGKWEERCSVGRDIDQLIVEVCQPGLSPAQCREETDVHFLHI